MAAKQAAGGWPSALADESKATLAEFQCGICLEIVRDCVEPQTESKGGNVTGCGHLFCLECFQTVRENSCPVCRAPVKRSPAGTNLFVASQKIRRDVLNFKMHCPRMENGCPWKGTLRDLDGHNEECQVIVTRCQDCQKQLLSGELAKHLLEDCVERTISCNLCQVCMFNCVLPSFY